VPGLGLTPEQALALVSARGYAIERVPGAALDDRVLVPLHAFASRLMAESYDHFARHARTNDELHVYRLRDEIVGFQLWRTLGDAAHRFVLGGKLRIDLAARRNALHHASNLAMLLAERAGHPDAAITRLSIASLFGFVSLARVMPHYRFVDDAAAPALAAVFGRVSADSGYVFAPKTGLVDVGITIPSDQLVCIDAGYLALPQARAYLARNADFARNRCFAAVAFEVDEVNVSSLIRRSGQQSPA
jgi:hypothetical protein